ncbi:30S ribosomal protein S8 [Chloroflexota bacterium]
MSLTDPIADMLTRVRNANTARHDSVPIPASKIKIAIAKVLKEEGFINDYEVIKGNTPQRMLKVRLKYTEKSQPVLSNLKRVSKPGLRAYCQRGEIPRVYGGLGIAILSTPLGVLTGHQAWKNKVGGEVLCYVW